MPDQNYKIGLELESRMQKGIAALDADIARINQKLSKPLSGMKLAPGMDPILKSMDLTTKAAQGIQQNLEMMSKSGSRAFKALGDDIDKVAKKLEKTRQSSSGFFGDGGPANFRGPLRGPRTDPREQAIRDSMAGMMKGMRDRAISENNRETNASIEAEARKRLFGDKPLDEAFKIGLKPRMKSPPAIDFSDLTRSEQQSRVRLQQWLRLNGGGAATGAGTASAGGGGSGGGGGGGRGGDVIGGFLRLEDKVALGGGNKLIGPVATAAASAIALSQVMGFTGNVIREYKDSMAKGIRSSEAFASAMMDAGKSLPIFGSVLAGIAAIGDEFTGVGDFNRAQERAARRKDKNQMVKETVAYNAGQLNDSRWNNNFADKSWDVAATKDPLEARLKQIRLDSLRQTTSLLSRRDAIENDPKLLESTKKQLIEDVYASIKLIGGKLRTDLANASKEAAAGRAEESAEAWRKFYDDMQDLEVKRFERVKDKVARLNSLSGDVMGDRGTLADIVGGDAKNQFERDKIKREFNLKKQAIDDQIKEDDVRNPGNRQIDQKTRDLMQKRKGQYDEIANLLMSRVGSLSVEENLKSALSSTIEVTGKSGLALAAREQAMTQVDPNEDKFQKMVQSLSSMEENIAKLVENQVQPIFDSSSN